MKLYSSVGPNPAVVTMFLAEKGVELPTQKVDLVGGENRQPGYVAKNPAGQLPCLELDDGTVLAEITAICEYLDEKYPTPPLIGTTPEERAETRMWVRRLDLNICEPLTSGFRYAEGLPLFQSRMRTIPHAASDLKEIAKEKLAWLDGLMAGKTWIAGERFTLADIMLFCFIQFGATVGQALDPDNKNLAAWQDRVKARVAEKASA
ncbi:MAG: glutathione S-transferase family protein [Pseudomonadota bacterium]|uniref:glutathione S-transferase family protein n=1 Tax=unclassified Phenylobacterium TaxID=2640670 RepID=UPI0006F581E2|nr:MULTISPECIES: glutathione S-transferase family protein [unclassified Phenylobacterium]KRB52257.1 glutathione S-transferase [Phenylobacterium sp. Root700]MBT9472982.1 glutathione S-transferase family protein [Phenylobacterium sp.]